MHMHGGLPPERVFCTRDRNKALEKLAHIVEELGFVKRKKKKAGGPAVIATYAWPARLKKQICHSQTGLLFWALTGRQKWS